MLKEPRDLEVTDDRRQKLTWNMIEMYERQKNYARLEETLVNFWQTLTLHSTSKDTTIQRRRVDVALHYVEFLKAQKRIIEAENIIRGVWMDLEHHDSHSTAIITRKKQVGDGLRYLGAVAAAQAVFASL